MSALGRFRKASSLPAPGAAICLAILAGLLVAASPIKAAAATYSGIVMDAKTGKTLYEYRSGEKAYPASLTKMMTLYLVFEALEAGRLEKNSKITFSSHASSMPPTKLGVKPGNSITVEQAILALVTKSANDAAAAVAEKLGGTESQFAELMTKKAHELGMKNTRFRNASGLPNSSQVSTAHDMAILGIALREHFPQYYDYFSARSFTFSGHRMGNHNRLLGKIKGVDGIKTGYTRASGFNLVSSVERDNRSIVAVVMGGRTGNSRNEQMIKLINGYLGKASRGEDRIVVARRGINRFEVAELPKKGPTPTFRDDALDPTTQRVLAAHVISADIASTSGSGFSVTAIQERLRQLSGHELPVPRPSPSQPGVSVASIAPAPSPARAAEPDPVRTAAVRPLESVGASSVEPVAYTEEPAPQAAAEAIERTQSGWQIQIGAVPSQDAATRLLEKARDNAPGLLGKVRNYTETVEKSGSTLYRARFSGFGSKTAAWDACGQLKKKNFACLAIYN